MSGKFFIFLSSFGRNKQFLHSKNRMRERENGKLRNRKRNLKKKKQKKERNLTDNVAISVWANCKGK